MIETFRSKKLIIPTLALAAGASACGGHKHNASVPVPTTSHESVVPQVRNISNINQTATKIIELAKDAPTGPEFKPDYPDQYQSKPPYTIGFTQGTTDGGKIDLSVQTKTPQFKPSQAEQIEVQKTSKNHIVEYDLTIDALDDGNWTSHCDTLPFSTHGSSLSEIDLQTVQRNTGPVDHRPIDAETILADELFTLNHIVDSAMHVGTAPVHTPVGDICKINLG